MITKGREVSPKPLDDSRTEGRLVAGERLLTVASLNVHWGLHPDGRPFDLVDACRSLTADVIALQEVWTPLGQPSPATRVAEQLGYQVLEAPLTRSADITRLRVVPDSQAKGSWGLALLTTLPVLTQTTIDLGQAPGDTVRRAAQHTVLSLPDGRVLHTVNTHLSHRPWASPFQLQRLARHLRADAPHTVLLGDLNMVGPLATALSGRRRAVFGATWPATRPVAQLDHVLISRDLTARHGAVLTTVGSDHLPIRAQLQFKTNQQTHLKNHLR